MDGMRQHGGARSAFPSSNTNGIVEGRAYSILETEDLPTGNYTIMIVLGNLVYTGKFHITH